MTAGDKGDDDPKSHSQDKDDTKGLSAQSDPAKPDPSETKDSSNQNPPPVSPTSKFMERMVNTVPMPFMDRAYPFFNCALTDTTDPWKDVKEITRTSCWIGSMFGIGTFLGQMTWGLPLRTVLRRSALGAVVG